MPATSPDLKAYLDEAVDLIAQWEHAWGTFDRHPSVAVDPARFREALARYAARLGDNYPFFHPRYAGQMLKPPHPAAVVGYLGAMLINPNNHALDGGPATGEMEKEVVRMLAACFHLPEDTLGHLTTSGTIANLEALWVGRAIHPDRAVAVSEEAHYTHSRMSELLGVECLRVPADERGRMRLDALEDLLRTGQIGTVVLTAGTTGFGAVDPIADVVSLRERHGCRLHVDAAYGGFFTLLARAEDPETASLLAPETRRHLQAIAACDSVTVDPHKHGLQPYGCGAVLFRDPSVGRLYRHDSPYTYFTSDALHLGEISLECSRAGAAAGALWLTLQLLPLTADDGLGAILSACRRAALDWHARLEADDLLRPLQLPELDIVTFFPAAGGGKASDVDAASQALFERAMAATAEPVFLSVLRAASRRIAAAWAPLVADRPEARVLRSVLMKPEHEAWVPTLHARVRSLAAEIDRGRVPSTRQEDTI